MNREQINTALEKHKAWLMMKKWETAQTLAMPILAVQAKEKRN